MSFRTLLLGVLLGFAIGARRTRRVNVTHSSQDEEGLSITLSTCSCLTVWLSYPVPRNTVLEWMRAQVEDKDQDELPELETPKDYNNKYPGHHPIWLEFNIMFECKNAGFIPYPEFQQIAIQIPYVRWRGHAVRYQPWGVMDNMFGRLALTTLGARSVEASPFEVSFDAEQQGNWTQFAQVADKVSFGVSALVDSRLDSHESLQDRDETWRELMKRKLEPEVAYKEAIWPINHKYSCFRIRYDLEKTRATRVVRGNVHVAFGDGDGGNKFVPVSIHSALADLDAYAVHTTYTAEANACK